MVFATQVEARCVEDERAELRVVAGVGSSVVLLDVQVAMAHAADRTPVEAAEVYD